MLRSCCDLAATNFAHYKKPSALRYEAFLTHWPESISYTSAKAEGGFLGFHFLVLVMLTSYHIA